MTRITPDKALEFKRALRSAARAISGDPELEIEDAPDGDDAPSIHDIPNQPLSLEDAICQRGEADLKALRKRYHDENLHLQYLLASGPAQEIHDALERVRVETLGARQMKGVAENVAASNKKRILDEGLFHIREENTLPMASALSLLVRERLLGEVAPSECRFALRAVRKSIEEKTGHELDQLDDSLEDQEAYSETVFIILRNLDLMATRQDQENANDSEDQGEDGADDDTSMEESIENSEDGEEQTSLDDAELEALLEGEETDLDDSDARQLEPGEDTPYRSNKRLDDPNPLSFYRVYSPDFDETIKASELATPEELSRLRLQLDRQMANLQRTISKLANRLQRYLLAKQNRAWNFDLEEGLLDAGKLARIVVNPLSPLSFKVESEIVFKDTVVTLLIDNSGSMRGKPISTAAISADILARTLERCGIAVEILGFTTKEWKGGRVREQWLSDGKPKNPGRLNELRHIIYKTADQPWRRARNSMGLMMREGILKENIDGEALLWAHRRLLARPEERRILMVISDGAPVDDSTLSANTGPYLERHLRGVIEWIENASEIELLAIGIGHDVTQYYSQAVTISDPEELSGAMMDQLVDLFAQEQKSPRQRARA